MLCAGQAGKLWLCGLANQQCQLNMHTMIEMQLSIKKKKKKIERERARQRQRDRDRETEREFNNDLLPKKNNESAPIRKFLLLINGVFYPMTSF